MHHGSLRKNLLKLVKRIDKAEISPDVEDAEDVNVETDDPFAKIRLELAQILTSLPPEKKTQIADLFSDLIAFKKICATEHDMIEQGSATEKYAKQKAMMERKFQPSVHVQPQKTIHEHSKARRRKKSHKIHRMDMDDTSSSSPVPVTPVSETTSESISALRADTGSSGSAPSVSGITQEEPHKKRFAQEQQKLVTLTRTSGALQGGQTIPTLAKILADYPPDDADRMGEVFVKLDLSKIKSLAEMSQFSALFEEAMIKDPDLHKRMKDRILALCRSEKQGNLEHNYPNLYSTLKMHRSTGFKGFFNCFHETASIKEYRDIQRELNVQSYNETHPSVATISNIYGTRGFSRPFQMTAEDDPAKKKSPGNSGPRDVNITTTSTANLG